MKSIIDRLPESIIREIEDAISEIRLVFEKRNKNIRRIGEAIQSGSDVDQSDICVMIKYILRKEIEDKVISSRDIERACPDEWKRKTKPKGTHIAAVPIAAAITTATTETKNDKLSYSGCDFVVATPDMIPSLIKELELASKLNSACFLYSNENGEIIHYNIDMSEVIER